MRNLDFVQLGNRMKDARSRKKITQKGLADLIDSEESVISRIENGYKGCSLERFVRIAKALGVSPDYLLKDSLDYSEISQEDTEIFKIVSDCTPTEIFILIKALNALRAILKDFTIR